MDLIKIYLAKRYSDIVTNEVLIMEGRCFKCKKQVEIKNGNEVIMKNGLKAMKGECHICGTKVFRILGKS